MRCIHCGSQNTYRERSPSGQCKRCRFGFAFEPRAGSPLTDMAFKHAIDVVSDGGRLAWLERQLYYEACRRVRRRRWLHRLTRRPVVSLRLDTFADMLSRWIAVHGPPAGRLPTNAFAEAPRDEGVARELRDYGFETLVICGTDGIADFLLANGFHADHKCPVLSVSRYPPAVHERLIDGLRDRPPRAVIVIHDADWNGCALPTRVATDPRWFGGVEVNIVDAGLGPGSGRRFRGLWLERSARGVLHTRVSADDARWLNTYRLELEAARPRALLSMLARIVRGAMEEPHRDPEDDDGSGWAVGGWPLSGDDDVG